MLQTRTRHGNKSVSQIIFLLVKITRPSVDQQLQRRPKISQIKTRSSRCDNGSQRHRERQFLYFPIYRIFSLPFLHIPPYSNFQFFFPSFISLFHSCLIEIIVSNRRLSKRTVLKSTKIVRAKAQVYSHREATSFVERSPNPI